MNGNQAIATEPIEITQDRFERHRRKCSICNHPDREEIEQEFVMWREAWSLARQYGIQDCRSIYRHAALTGLLDRRRANMRWALDSIIERRPDKVTADAVIRAVRAQTCLTDDNRWIEPPTHVVFSAAHRDELPHHSASQPQFLPQDAISLPLPSCGVMATLSPAAKPGSEMGGLMFAGENCENYPGESHCEADF